MTSTRTLFCISLILSAGCGNSATDAGPDARGLGLANSDRLELQIIPDFDWRTLAADEVRIAAATVDGLELHLTLQFPGGCRPHQFVVVAGTDLAQSNPPYTLFRLGHNANGDACEAFLTRNVTVDLRPMVPVLRASGARALRFELVEPGERRSSVGELLLTLP